MGIVDFVILGIVAAALTAALVYIAKCHRKGKCVGCSGDCSQCALKKKDK